MKRFALLTAAVVLFGACDDGTGPVRVGEVEIRLNGSSVDERTLEVGETVQLTASVFDEGGNPITGRQVSWSSSVPSVATVTQEGLVTGASAGETIVRATVGSVSDEVVIVVQAAPADLVCEPGAAGISLAVGQVHATDANSSPLLCIQGGSAGSEYVLVPFNSAPGANLLQVEIAASGTIKPIGPPNPSLMPLSGASGGLRVPAIREDAEFHFDLRERERRELAPLVRGASEPGGMRAMYSQGPSYASVPTVESLVTYNVNANNACSQPIHRAARVKAVSQRAIIVEDTLNPSGGFTTAEYEHFATTFDTLVYPTVTRNFGEPVDIDDNGGRSIILFTKAVNELTPAGSDSYVSGFFFSRDLFPKVKTETMSACATSNEAEMFYMLVPDPNGEVNGNKRSKDFVAERTVGVLAHEFQHLVNASRRLFVVKASGTGWVEDTWLNEGLSHIAEELVFYEATGLQPRQNIGIQPLRDNASTFDAFVEYQWSNFGRYIEYLRNPATQSALGVDANDHDLPTRGAIWAFLRYAADRKAGTESSLWRGMVDTDRVGLANLDAALGDQTLAWLRDWTMAVYSDDVLSTASPFQQPSWNFREIITSLRSASTGNALYPVYPLHVVELGNGTSNQRSVQLQGGGADYLKFGVAAGTTTAVRATSGGLTAPSRLKLTLVRTK